MEAGKLLNTKPAIPVYLRWQTMNLTLKQSARTGLIFLAVLLLGAAVYYKQRMLFGDAPWIAFHIINRQNFFIQEHRYGSFITQLFPLLASKLHMSMAGVLLAYSLSFNLFYWCTAWILYRIEAYGLSLLTALYCGLIASSTYFWTNNEVHQGICWMLLLFGWIQWSGSRSYPQIYTVIPFIPLAFLAVFSHPLVILITGFVWVYFLLEDKIIRLRSADGIVYSILLCALVAWKYYYSINGWYDGDKLGHVTHASRAQILAALRSPVAAGFLRDCIVNYWGLVLLFIWGCVILAYRKQGLRLIWVLLAAAGYFTLICITYIDCKLPFYLESEWMGMAVIGCMAFTREVLPRLRTQLAVPLLAVIFAARAVYILLAAAPFNERLNFLEQLTQKLQASGHNKVILPRAAEDTPLERALIMSWAMPVETMMLSEMKGGPVVTAVQVYSQELAQKIPARTQDFMTTFSTIPLQEINRYYFRYDTSTSYQVISYEAIMR